MNIKNFCFMIGACLVMSLISLAFIPSPWHLIPCLIGGGILGHFMPPIFKR